MDGLLYLIPQCRWAQGWLSTNGVLSIDVSIHERKRKRGRSACMGCGVAATRIGY